MFPTQYDKDKKDIGDILALLDIPGLPKPGGTASSGAIKNNVTETIHNIYDEADITFGGPTVPTGSGFGAIRSLGGLVPSRIEELIGQLVLHGHRGGEGAGASPGHATTGTGT